jgi:hypothetical protein
LLATRKRLCPQTDGDAAATQPDQQPFLVVIDRVHFAPGLSPSNYFQTSIRKSIVGVLIPSTGSRGGLRPPV